MWELALLCAAQASSFWGSAAKLRVTRRVERLISAGVSGDSSNAGTWPRVGGVIAAPLAERAT